MSYNEIFMLEAIAEARKAQALGEVPIGAIIVKDNTVIARGYNLRETKKNALMHAEVVAIIEASQVLDSWRLIDCDIYVTIEPCPMCAGAILQSRISNLYFGAIDEKGGGIVSKANILDIDYNHTVKYEGGYLADESKHLLVDFFRELRK